MVEVYLHKNFMNTEGYQTQVIMQAARLPIAGEYIMTLDGQDGAEIPFKVVAVVHSAENAAVLADVYASLAMPEDGIFDVLSGVEFALPEQAQEGET